MRNLNGNVALTTVLVLSALFVITAIAIIFQAMDFANSTSSYTNQIYAQNTAFSCIEEAYYKISRDPTYAEDEPLNFEVEIDPNRKCNATVESTNLAKTNRVISIESNYRGANYSTKRTIEDVTATDWVIN